MSDGRRLQDKVAIVTGSSGGIGRALAVSLAAQGTKLVVCADLQSKARTGPSDFGGSAETHELINQTQGEGKAIFVQCNVSKEETVAAVVQEAVNKAGRLDIIINNAGAGVLDIKSHEMKEEEWDKAMNTDAKGTFFGVKHATAQFLKQDLDNDGFRGTLINVASIGGLVGLFECAAYCACKAATIGFTRAVAVEYATQGIRCNAICPGYIDTSMIAPFVAMEQFAAYLKTVIPTQKLGKPEDIAGAAVWLATNKESAYVNGLIMQVDGGMTTR